MTVDLGPPGGAATDSGRARNLGDILGPRRHSDAIAVISLDRSGQAIRWTCAQIEQGAQAVAAMLASRGYAPGTRIGIFSANSVPYLMAYLGIMRSGCVCVPVNVKQPKEILAFICADAELALALVDDHGAAPQGLETLALDAIAPGPDEPTPTRGGGGDTALILYTSGSTGRPKGVVLSHHSQLSMIDAMTGGSDNRLFADQRGIVVAPMFHMNALIFIKSYLSGGGSIVLMSKFEARQFASAIEQFRVNVITGVPTMMAMLHRVWPELGGAGNGPDWSSVHSVYIGSAPVTEAIVHQTRQMMPRAQVLNSYGTTETGGGLFGPHPDGLARPATSVGHPLSHVALRLEDGDGETQGRLLVKGPSAMTGYLNLPEMTAERLRDGWFDTGDLFRVDANGFYYFVGRADDMFVCSGENVYPGEVEKAIESHPAVVQASVVPVPDTIRGQMPVAFVVGGTGLTATEVQEHVKRMVAPYLYPRRVWFLEALPLASTAKVDRRRLMEQAQERIGQETS